MKPRGPEGRRVMGLAIERFGAGIAMVMLGLFLDPAAQAAEKLHKLSGPQISQRLAGMELTDEVHSADVFERNGVLVSHSMGRRTTGKWRVQKNMLCLDRGKEGAECYEVWLAGKKVELRRPGSDLPLEGILQRPTKRK
jgi:hypothetical protein